jgi:D-lactate dehydrogenase
MIINTSRGKLIDTRDLIEALKHHKVGYVGLDVYEEEADLFFEDLSNRMIEDEVFLRLLTFPNVLVTGHQAFLTREALTGIAQTTLQNLSDFEAGKPLVNEVKA